MIWRVFRRSRSATVPAATWWGDAAAAAEAPTSEAIAALRRAMTGIDADADDAERQEEMIDGLEALRHLSAEALPVVETQHRVIGSDRCHVMLPATLTGPTDVPGKLFLTSNRLVFAGGHVLAWPWHRVRSVIRVERAIVVSMAGGEPVQISCNSYGDALVAVHVAARLKP